MTMLNEFNEGALRSCSNRRFGSFRLTNNADSVAPLFTANRLRNGISLSTYADTRRIAITGKMPDTGFPSGRRLCSLLAGKTGYPPNLRFFHMHILQTDQRSGIGGTLNPDHLYLAVQPQALKFKYGYLSRFDVYGFGKINH